MPDVSYTPLFAILEQFTASSDDSSSTFRAIRTKPDYPAKQILDGWTPNNFGQVLVYLKVLGRDLDELAMLRLALDQSEEGNRLQPVELARYIETAYTEIGKHEFEHGEYARGIGTVSEALKRMRLITIPPLSGSDSPDETASPLLIIEAFFPPKPVSNEEFKFYSSSASLILTKTYEDVPTSGDIATHGSDWVKAFITYMDAVKAFRLQDFDSARKKFERAVELAKTNNAADLGRLMLIRTEFYDALPENIQGTDKRDHESAVDAENSNAGNAEKKETAATRQLATALANAFVDAMIREGVLRRQSDPSSEPTQGSDARKRKRKAGVSAAESAAIRSAIDRIKELETRMNSDLRRRQAAAYREALQRFL